MENTVKDRLMSFLREKKISQSAFEKNVGLSNGYVNNISKGIGADKLQKIIGAYPELSQEWLLTGKGEMLNNTQAIDNNNLTNSTIQQGNYINDLAVISKIHDDFQNIICKKDEQINELLTIIKQLTNK